VKLHPEITSHIWSCTKPAYGAVQTNSKFIEDTGFEGIRNKQEMFTNPLGLF